MEILMWQLISAQRQYLRQVKASSMDNMSPEMDARNHNLPTNTFFKTLVHVSSELLEDHRQTESCGPQNLPLCPDHVTKGMQ